MAAMTGFGDFANCEMASCQSMIVFGVCEGGEMRYDDEEVWWW